MRMVPLKSGWIEVVCGPMFSGKSEEMIRRLNRVQYAKQRAIVFKPMIDDRWSKAEIVSRNGLALPALSIHRSAEILEAAPGFDVIGIDEAQFFDSELASVIQQLADQGARVVVAGLDTDYRRSPFGGMHEILAIADFVDKLQAVCHACGGPATLTQRLINGQPAPFSGETIQVGDSDSYEARCRDCYQSG